MEKMHNANRNKKKKLDWLYHKIDFERKQTGKNNIMDWGRFYNDKGPIHQEDIKIINTYASNKSHKIHEANTDIIDEKWIIQQ